MEVDIKSNIQEETNPKKLVYTGVLIKKRFWLF